MTDNRICTATKKDGAPCTVPAVRGTDKCFAHSKTREQQRKAQAGQARQRRAKKLNPLDAFQGATLVQVTDMAGKCLNGIPLISHEAARHYNGPREVTPEGVYVGLMLLLVLTGPHLSPSEARVALDAAVPLTMRPPYMPPPEDVYRAGRAEWRKAALVYREATGLLIDVYPPHLIAGWEDAWEVLKNEPLPTFEDWQVEPLGDSPTHVLARSPEGAEVIVRREISFASA
jgi:hypothetical protein